MSFSLRCFKIVKVQISKCAAEIKRSREHVFDLRDPRDRFRHHWMHGKNRSRKPAPTKPEFPQHESEQNGVYRMQQNVDDMINKRPRSPELVFQPENRPGYRIVLLKRAEIEPDITQSAQAATGLIVPQPRVVVPNESVWKRGQISNHRDHHNQQCSFGGITWPSHQQNCFFMLSAPKRKYQPHRGAGPAQ